jgi:hypothetical protein
MIKVTDDALDEALAQARLANELQAFAEARAKNANAIYLGLCILRHAAEHPGIKSITFDTNAEYDDEGSYYNVLSVWALNAEDEQIEDEALDDLCCSHRPEEMYALSGEHWEGTLEIAKLPERITELQHGKAPV